MKTIQVAGVTLPPRTHSSLLRVCVCLEIFVNVA